MLDRVRHGLACWGAMLLLAHAGYSQGRPDLAPEVQALRAEARPHLVEADATLAWSTRAVPGGQIDRERGIWRAVYHIEPQPTSATTAREAAAQYLSREAAAFGWEGVSELRLMAVQQRPRSYHLTYQQTVRGVPVYGRYVRVSLDARRQPTMVMSGYAPGLQEAALNLAPRVAAGQAAQQAQALVIGAAQQVAPPTLYVYPAETPRLVWQVVVTAAGVPGEWEVLLDAHSGEVVRLLNHSPHAGPTRRRSFTSYLNAPHHPALLEAQHETEEAPPVRQQGIVGKGYIFAPDPLTTAGQPYAPPYVDSNDADVPELNAERVLVDLQDLTQGTDGLFRLTGPHVEVIGGSLYQPPAEASPEAFLYTRANDHFEAVMAYYHIDISQRRVQELGFQNVQNLPITVNPKAFFDDVSFYSSTQNRIELGAGNVDDAEDAELIWHEYGHALLHAIVPGMNIPIVGQSIHEGWSDYWATSYTRSLLDLGKGERSDWELVFPWDTGDYTYWISRTLNSTGAYPEATRCEDPNDSNRDGCDKYEDGAFWATVMMDLREVLGRHVMDELHLQAFFYLTASALMPDLAAALVQADQDLFAGAHLPELVTQLDARGLLNADAYGPSLAHEPPGGTERTTGTFPLRVETQPVVGAVDSVIVFYGADLSQPSRLVLQPDPHEASAYVGELPLPGMTGEVRYYLEGVDVEGRRSRLPTTAPAEFFSFSIGPDTEAPVITHAPIAEASLVGWPAEVVASVTDNYRVDSVWVSFELIAPEGGVQQAASFPLVPTDDTYWAAFPIAVGSLRNGSVVRYQVQAQDEAANTNTAVVPTTGHFEFTVVAEGVLRAYSFEGATDGVSGTGLWARGTPGFGLRIAHAGQTAWGTVLADAYPATAQLSSLELPALNLSDHDAVYLTFWHWHDFEHDGTATPEGTRATLWDGGNVKVSTNGGQTWRGLVPEGGYDGNIVASTDNPMGGQSAFGGYSYGWRQALVALPTEADVRLRFDFGTDGSNDEPAVAFAGWFIDDVQVTTILPQDAADPTVLQTPDSLEVLAVGNPVPPFEICVTDDQGIAQVTVNYAALRRTGSNTNGSLRLAMAADDRNLYTAAPPADLLREAGDVLTYRFRITDVAGNRITVPDTTQPAFRLEARHVDVQALAEAATATGRWTRAGTAWTFVPGSSASLSSLLFPPLDLAANTAGGALVLEHTYQFAEGLGGNLKISTNDGRAWEVLAPVQGYGATFPTTTAHPMQEEAIFSGTRTDTQTSTFDLAPYRGQQVRLRLDFGTIRELSTSETWVVRAVRLEQSTTAAGFETPRRLALHANFPDPFSATTQLGYTLHRFAEVRLEVYDLLGRRVAQLVTASQEAGTYTLTFDGSNLAPGVYLLRLLANGQQRTERLLITR